MSSWNYRIFKREYPEAITPIMYELHEVYYNDAKQIVAWTTKPQGGPVESVEDLLDEIRMKAHDIWQSRKDILDYSMKPEAEWPPILSEMNDKLDAHLVSNILSDVSKEET